MIRRSMFWGLTLVLIIALAALILRGRRMEKQQAGRLVEIVQKSQPTPTRALAPPDIEIVRATMRLEKGAGGKARDLTAHHEIEIRNNGSVPYGEIQLRFTYLGGSGKPLAYRTHTLEEGITPGAILKMTGIVFGDLPDAAANSRASVDYADLKSDPSPKR